MLMLSRILELLRRVRDLPRETRLWLQPLLGGAFLLPFGLVSRYFELQGSVTLAHVMAWTGAVIFVSVIVYSTPEKM